MNLDMSVYLIANDHSTSKAPEFLFPISEIL